MQTVKKTREALPKQNEPYIEQQKQSTAHSTNGFYGNGDVPPENKQAPIDGALFQRVINYNQQDITAPDDGKAVSLEVYWEEYYGQTEYNYEWNNGILEAKSMAKLIQVNSYVWFLNVLRDFLFVTEMGQMTLLETAFQFDIPGQRKARTPDLAVVLDSNSIQLDPHDRTYAGVFDICIESVSDSKPSEIERDTVVKWDEYAQGGVTEYYVLDEMDPLDRKSETAFYRLGPNGVYQPIQPVNGVIQSTVLPGFQFRITDLVDQPRPRDMIDDPVYQGFISPDLRAERLRAERAEQEAREKQEELERSEQESQEKQIRLDQINAYLNAQGITLPDDLTDFG